MAEGSEAALGELYDRHSTLVNSVAMHVLRDADDAAEVVEEAFWQAWRQANRYEPKRGGVSTWLVTIARTRAVDRLRSRRRIREEAWESLPEPADAPDDGDGLTPLLDTEAEEVRRIVLAAVAKLPPEQRRTVEMAYFGGLSQTEIAAATGQPLGTVKTRARLALQKLRETLSVLREDAS